MLLNCFFHEIHNSRLGIENRNAPGIRFHFFEPLRMTNEVQNGFRQTRTIQIGIADNNCSLFLRHGERIFHLVVIRREGKRNQNGRTARSFDFRHRRRAGSRNDEIRRRVLLMEIVEEGTNVRFKTAR